MLFYWFCPMLSIHFEYLWMAGLRTFHRSHRHNNNKLQNLSSNCLEVAGMGPDPLLNVTWQIIITEYVWDNSEINCTSREDTEHWIANCKRRFSLFCFFCVCFCLCLSIVLVLVVSFFFCVDFCLVGFVLVLCWFCVVLFCFSSPSLCFFLSFSHNRTPQPTRLIHTHTHTLTHNHLQTTPQQQIP